jgi:hypothetical protein
VISRYTTSMVFYTDGSLIDGCAGFAIHQTGFGHYISSPAAMFTAQLIGEVTQPTERCLISTDNLSSIKVLLSRKISHRTHPLSCLRM